MIRSTFKNQRPIGMTMMKSHSLRLLLFAFFVTCTSCASGPPKSSGPSPAQIAGQDAKTILVAPFNIVSALPPELEGSTRMVSTELVKHIEAHGKKVHLISFRSGRDIWKESMKEVRDSGKKKNFENAAKVYAQKLGASVEFDALIVPSIFIQNAKTRGRTVRWDGAEQSIEMSGSTGSGLYVGQTGSHNVRAASIFVHIVNRQGEVIQTKRSGLELIEHLEWKVKMKGGYSGTEEVSQNVVPDVPPLEDKEQIRTGVAASLSPFLPIEPVVPAAETLETPDTDVAPSDAAASEAS
jgi:hypothetical protein